VPPVKLYWMSVSHPSQAARKMLELKGVDFQVVDVLPLNQRVHLRLAGFRGGTVPALKLDDRRVQGSRQIARVLDELWPTPPLFPADPALRARVEEAERWGDEVLQPVPRRIARYGAVHSLAVRRWGAAESPLPGREVAARISGPLVRYYLRTTEADGRRGEEAVIRADLAALPSLLDRVDQLLADGTLDPSAPNAATLQILSSVCLLDAIADLRELVGAHACAAPARELFSSYPGPIPPFLPVDWVPHAAPG
jgi:glutathione S-transferase